MIEYVPSPMATVTSGVPKLIQEGDYVRFTDKWPVQLNFVSGKTFFITKTNEVPYDLHYIIPTNDYTDVDFSNEGDGVNIYPTETNTLYQVALGFKPANVLADIYIPAGEYAQRLQQPSMVPTLSSNTLRYLGAFNPVDSPYFDKRMFFYFVYNLEPLIMRLYVDYGIDYDKVVLGLTINKCFLQQISPTPEQLSKAKVLHYYTELRW